MNRAKQIRKQVLELTEEEAEMLKLLKRDYETCEFSKAYKCDFDEEN
jgi:hypothetical protein